MRRIGLLLATLFVVNSAQATTTLYVKKGDMLNHSQFLKLSETQQKKYIFGLREIFAKMPHGTETFASNQMFTLISKAYAEDEAYSQCVYGGFVQARDENDKCKPKYTGDFTLNGKPVKLKCTKGEDDKRRPALCNPLLFGVKSDGSPICEDPFKSMTSACKDRSAKEAKVESIVDFVKENEKLWDEFSVNYTKLCDNARAISGSVTRGSEWKRVKDVDVTCQQSKDRHSTLLTGLNDLNQKQEEERQAKIAEIEKKAAEGFTCGGSCPTQYENWSSYYIWPVNTSHKTKSIKTTDYKGLKCKVSYVEGKGYVVNYDKDTPIKNAMYKRLTFRKFNRIKQPPTTDSDGNPMLTASSDDGRDLQITKVGESCKIKLIKTNDNEHKTAELIKNKKNQCLGYNDDEKIGAFFDDLAEAAKSDNCDIRRIDVRATPKSKFIRKKQHPQSCPVRITGDMKSPPAGEFEVEIVPFKGKAKKIKLSSFESNDLQLASLKQAGFCFDNVNKKVNFISNRKNTKTAKTREDAALRLAAKSTNSTAGAK